MCWCVLTTLLPAPLSPSLSLFPFYVWLSRAPCLRVRGNVIRHIYARIKYVGKSQSHNMHILSYVPFNFAGACITRRCCVRQRPARLDLEPRFDAFSSGYQVVVLATGCCVYINFCHANRGVSAGKSVRVAVPVLTCLVHVCIGAVYLS